MKIERERDDERVTVSVTRFGEIPPLWQIFKNLIINIISVYLVLGKVFNSLWHNLYAVGQILIAENGQKLRIQFGHLVTLIMFDLDLMERSYLSLESISMKAYSVKLYGSLNCLSCNYSKILNVNFHIRWECSINKLWPNCHTLRTKNFH